MSPARAYKCVKCGMQAHNPHDIESRYCGNCHRFEDDDVNWMACNTFQMSVNSRVTWQVTNHPMPVIGNTQYEPGMVQKEDAIRFHRELANLMDRYHVVKVDQTRIKKT